ncbi:MAG: hypothetical protein P8J20_18270 [Novosphingobium sp.]|nr:hypothetical protein [Novosphingobium sp.]
MSTEPNLPESWLFDPHPSDDYKWVVSSPSAFGQVVRQRPFRTGHSFDSVEVLE